jgi:2-haloacid dehalogenase
MSVNYDRFDVLTFDCYGTLIDWETGLVRALREALPDSAGISDEALLETFGRYEAGAQRPYQTYRRVLAQSLRSVAAELGQAVGEDAVARFSESVRDWPPFPDSAEALARLKERFKLAVITNCDTDLFAASNQRLGVEFDWIITVEMAGSYKPDHNNFHKAFATIPHPKERILHVAQSLYHDHVPAKELGMTSVWIDRRHDREGSGATPVATATPDATFPSMAAFAESVAPDSNAERAPGAE